MGHTPETRRRAFAKMHARRQKWLEENGPCKQCGSTINLEVDHINPKTKIDHKVWSWAEERMLAELTKCQVLCRSCHHTKSMLERGCIPSPHGTVNRYRKGCRCAECREAHRLSNERWRKKLRG